jgi:hypothetical protein
MTLKSCDFGAPRFLTLAGVKAMPTANVTDPTPRDALLLKACPRHRIRHLQPLIFLVQEKYSGIDSPSQLLSAEGVTGRIGREIDIALLKAFQ